MKNIVSYELNDECCGVVDNKGKIRILKKKSNEGSFKTYLEIENEIDKLDKKQKDNLMKMKSIKQKCAVVLITAILSFLFLISTPLTGINAIITLLSSMTFCGLLTWNVIDLIDMQKKKDILCKEFKMAKKEINHYKKLISLLNENVYVHEPDLRHELRNSTIEEIIKDSIKSLNMYFHLNYDGELDNVIMNYFGDDKISFSDCESYFRSDFMSVNRNFNDDLSKNKKIYDGTLSSLLIYKDREQQNQEKQRLVDVHGESQIILPRSEEIERNLIDLLVYENEEERQKELKLRMHR